MLPRSSWEDPNKRVSGPAPKGTPKTWVIHYPGGGSAPVGAEVAPYLRGIQSSYLSSRGYSIGYNWGVAQDGSRWEIRGNDFNNAANAGRKVEGNFNNVSQSIFVMVADHDAATPAAVAAINSIIATHPDWDVIVHSDVDYTSCAGEGLTAQVRAGIIGQHAPTVPEEDEEMKPENVYIARPPAGSSPDKPWLVVERYGGGVRYAMNEDAGNPAIKQVEVNAPINPFEDNEPIEASCDLSNPESCESCS